MIMYEVASICVPIVGTNGKRSDQVMKDEVMQNYDPGHTEGLLEHVRVKWIISLMVKPQVIS